MSRLIKAVLFGCFIPFSLSAQKKSAEMPLQCTGKLPADFTTLSVVKSEMQMADEKKQYKGSSSVNSKKSEFITQSNYIIDELLLSGRVLFNDSVSAFLSDILDEILATETDLRKKLRVYALRSNSVNALTTNNGIIFVTTGLISEVENEAQLAFILAHEITHFEKRHVINSYLENDKIFSGSGSYRYNTYDDRIEAASSYSKELEYQADSNGIYRISQTRYALNEAVNSMDILQFADLPFDEMPFNASFLSAGDAVIPDMFYLDSVEPINLDRLENENDSRSSHPNIKSRREKLKNYYAGLKNSKSVEKYLNGKARFEQIRQIARKETIRIMLSDREYAESIYESLIMLKSDSTNTFYQKAIVKALYGIAKYKTAEEYSETAKSYGSFEGEIQQCIYLFKKLTAMQANFIACRHLYDLAKNESSGFYRDICNDLFVDLVNKYEFDYEKLKAKSDEFSEKLKTVNATDTVTVIDTVTVKEEDDNGSKYEKLRKQKTESVVKEEKTTIDPENHEFYFGLFTDIIDDPEFKNYVKSIETIAAEEKEREKEKEKIESKLTYYQKNQKELTEKQQRRKKGVALGIDTLIIVDPFYFELDRRREISVVNSEKKLVSFSVDIKELSGQAGITSTMIAPKLFTESDVANYNRMSLFNFWAGERLDHENIDIIPLETEYAAEAAKEIGTQKIMYSGVFSYTEMKDHVGWAIVATIIPYTAPFGLYYLLKPNTHTLYYTLVFDIETGICNLNESIHFNMDDKRGMIKSSIYDLMLQVKKEPAIKLKE